MRDHALLQENKMARYFTTLLKPQLPVNFLLTNIEGRFLHTSPALFKVTAGKVKPTPKGDKPITYEESLAPRFIAHRKSWNSWNTSTIEGGHRHSEIAVDDLFIRKFIQGAFPGRLLSKVIIKRQYNIIRIAAVFRLMLPPSRMCFMIGFTEELLSHWFQCIVKLEVQLLSEPKHMIFKHV